MIIKKDFDTINIINEEKIDINKINDIKISELKQLKSSLSYNDVVKPKKLELKKCYRKK